MSAELPALREFGGAAGLAWHPNQTLREEIEKRAKKCLDCRTILEAIKTSGAVPDFVASVDHLTLCGVGFTILGNGYGAKPHE